MKKLLPFIAITIVFLGIWSLFSFNVPYSQTNTSWTTTSAIGIGTATPDKEFTLNTPDWDWKSSTHNASFTMTSSFDNEEEISFQGMSAALTFDGRPAVPTLDFGTGNRAIFRKGIWTSTATNPDTAFYHQYGTAFLSVGSGSKTLVGMNDDASGYKLQVASLSYQLLRSSTALTAGNVLTVGSDGHSITAQPVSGGGGGSTNIYNSDGTLTGDRVLSGGNHELSIGTIASPTSGINLVASSFIQIGNNTADLDLYGAIFYSLVTFIDASATVQEPMVYAELPQITANRTITLPSVLGTARPFTIINLNTSGFTWTITNTVKTTSGGTFSTVPNGVTHLIWDGTAWYKE